MVYAITRRTGASFQETKLSTGPIPSKMYATTKMTADANSKGILTKSFPLIKQSPLKNEPNITTIYLRIKFNFYIL
jgi:hypothetical protein